MEPQFIIDIEAATWEDYNLVGEWITEVVIPFLNGQGAGFTFDLDVQYTITQLGPPFPVTVVEEEEIGCLTE